ncbi:hypothetical protein HY213_03100 [Candidatus Peregrinibacteria bacterium]|nr:hypothetical protein [Candidatus Peregrinibacteria bacterium]
MDRAYDEYIDAADHKGYNLPFRGYQEEVGIPEGRTQLCLTFEYFEAKILRQLAVPSSAVRWRLKAMFQKLKEAKFNAVDGEKELIQSVSTLAWESS